MKKSCRSSICYLREIEINTIAEECLACGTKLRSSLDEWIETYSQFKENRSEPVTLTNFYNPYDI